MPVHVDLAQFPRLVCRRCGLVALVDPALPLDLHPSLTCPNCARVLSRPPLAVRIDPEVPAPRAAAPNAKPAAARRDPAGTLPSNAVVGLTLAALFMAVLIVIFVIGMVTPHTNYWGALTK